MNGNFHQLMFWFDNEFEEYAPFGVWVFSQNNKEFDEVRDLLDQFSEDMKSYIDRIWNGEECPACRNSNNRPIQPEDYAFKFKELLTNTSGLPVDFVQYLEHTGWSIEKYPYSGLLVVVPDIENYVNLEYQFEYIPPEKIKILDFSVKYIGDIELEKTV